MNTKCNLASVLKTSEFSRVRSTSDYFDIFNSRDENFWYLPPPPPPEKKVNFLFILYLLLAICNVSPTENAKKKKK